MEQPLSPLKQGLNPQQESTRTIATVEGDPQAVLGGRCDTTESKLRSLNPVLRQFNPELSSWPSTEPLPAGSTLLLPVYRSNSPLPGRRAAPPAEEGMETLGSRLAQQPKTAASMR
jgi:hypothetical protein